MGAIVVCQGGDQPTVRLAILDAVSKVTGLGADKISILKMK
jgi:stage III sporulation protein AG